ncbi:hypothetical protein WCX72_09790 [Sulfurimonas sp. HSL1-6]|uniref:hypothetical protein n=1 Tax=Thiomicrolovo immobilis TaxID=3131935 RepID=UPI0031F91A1A
MNKIDIVYVRWKDGVIACPILKELENDELMISVMNSRQIVNRNEVNVIPEIFDGMAHFQLSESE